MNSPRNSSSSSSTSRKRPRIGSSKPPTVTQICQRWFLYPPPAGKPATFVVGDKVFFRPKSAKEKGRLGVVVEPQPAATDHVWAQFQSSETPKYVSCKRLIPVLSRDARINASTSTIFTTTTSTTINTTIILTPETLPYRLLASSQVNEDDNILEIGCSTGECSCILLRYGNSLVGFDSSQDMIDQCRAHIIRANQFDHSTKNTTNNGENDDSLRATMKKINPLLDPNAAALAQQLACSYSGPSGPDVVFLDIGGNREEESIIQMTDWVLQSFSNLRLLVIKSRELVKDIHTTKSDNINITTGVIENGSEWLDAKLRQANRPRLPKHPLQAPLVYSPINGTQPICRYHNYHPQGCIRHRDSQCCYDHEHCHLCLQPGHTALNCLCEN